MNDTYMKSIRPNIGFITKKDIIGRVAMGEIDPIIYNKRMTCDDNFEKIKELLISQKIDISDECIMSLIMETKDDLHEMLDQLKGIICKR